MGPGHKARDDIPVRWSPASPPELREALEFLPAFVGVLPGVGGLGVVPAEDVAGGALGFAAVGAAVVADGGEPFGGDDVVQVAEHLLQAARLLDEPARARLGVERGEELGGVAERLEGLAHLVALLDGE